MRIPSIHIDEQNLILALDKLKKVHNYKYNSKDLANNLLLESIKYSIHTRSINPSNKKSQDKVDKVMKSGLGDAMKFARVLYLVRVSMKHRGVTQINQASKEWPILKQITQDAVTFCKDFDLTLDQGFKEYLTLGISKMQKFALPKISAMAETISQTYEFTNEIKSDPNKSITENLSLEYNRAITLKTGIGHNYKDQPDKYVFFVRAAQLCKDLNIKPQDYVKAQFHGFEWISGIPDPVQFVGAKARERVMKYIYETGIKLTNNIDNPKIDWDKIRNHGNYSRKQ
jgi:hypothetical protein